MCMHTRTECFGVVCILMASMSSLLFQLYGTVKLLRDPVHKPALVPSQSSFVGAAGGLVRMSGGCNTLGVCAG